MSMARNLIFELIFFFPFFLVGFLLLTFNKLDFSQKNFGARKGTQLHNPNKFGAQSLKRSVATNHYF